MTLLANRTETDNAQYWLIKVDILFQNINVKFYDSTKI